MSLLGLILVLVVVGFILWAINVYIPLDPLVKKILNVVVIVVLVIWLLNAFGLLSDLRSVRVPRI